MTLLEKLQPCFQNAENDHQFLKRIFNKEKLNETINYHVMIPKKQDEEVNTVITRRPPRETA